MRDSLPPFPLPLPLKRRQNALVMVPLLLKRRHHQIDEEVTKRLVSISGCQILTTPPSALQSQALDTLSQSLARTQDFEHQASPTVSINDCQTLRASMAHRWQSCRPKRFARATLLHNIQALPTRANPSLQSALAVKLYAHTRLHFCLHQGQKTAFSLVHCLQAIEPKTLWLKACLADSAKPAMAWCCQSALEGKAKTLASPCRFVKFEIQNEPPKPPEKTSPCKPPPPSHQLPFPLARQNLVQAHLIPLPLQCWHQPTVSKPSRSGIIMFNQIKILIDDKPFDALSVSLQTDDQSALWQGTIELAPKDFEALRLFERKIGDEPIVSIDINGYQWRMMLERDVRDKRQHAAHGGYAYQIPMRSVTARLGGDYATPQTQLITGDRYARQIADEILENTGFKIGNWLIADWFIPENTYTLGSKTILATLAEIAQAAGGFIESDRVEPRFHLKPRYPKPAWQTQTPSYSLPASLIKSISGNTRQSALLNGVRIIPQSGGSAGHITREGTDGSPEAPDQVHPLYTDQPVWLAKATQILSDSGTHKFETVETYLHPKHGAILANLGDVWQIDEVGQYWHGVVRSISINVSTFEVTQSITLDRFIPSAL